MRNQHKQQHTKEIHDARGTGLHCEGDKYIVRKTFLVYFHESSCSHKTIKKSILMPDPILHESCWQ